MNGSQISSSCFINSSTKPKIVNKVVLSCLKEGDFTTLDNLLLNRSDRDIERYYEKKASSLLLVAITSLQSESLNYLIDKKNLLYKFNSLKLNNFSNKLNSLINFNS